jgi:hypothetical protein
MVSKSKATARAADRALPNRAWEHGANAFGARFLQPGISLRPELDLAFALGYGAPGHVGPIELAPDLAPDKKPKSTHDRIERNVAIAGLRGGSTYPEIPPHEANPAPITEDEARALVKEHFPWFALPPVYWHALEAMVGPSCLLPAVVQALEELPDDRWKSGRLESCTPLLHGLLLRTTERESLDARAALEALLRTRARSVASVALDIMLHGREGIARCGYKYSSEFKSFRRNDSADPSNVRDLLFCDGDAEFVAAQFAALWKVLGYKVQKWMSGPSPARLFFLGGDSTLETEALVVDRYPGTMQAEALASYRDLASPLATGLIARLATETSKVKRDAEACLTERRARE